MTGNDIVDLESAKTPCGARGDRFLQKIFTGEEQEIINTGRVGVWALWAMKEAVYKAHHRRFSLPRSFDPKGIKISIEETIENSVIARADYCGFDYWGQGKITSEYAFFTATCLPKEQLYSEIFRISSKQIKNQLKLAISNKLNIEIKDLEIVKDENSIPHIRVSNFDLNLPFSISHHGKFASFSFQIMNY